MATSYHSEATSLVRKHWSEATRPVQQMKRPVQQVCYCGGRYENGHCEREECPRAKLGGGSWHVALPKLQELWSQGRLGECYPHINLYDLQESINGCPDIDGWKSSQSDHPPSGQAASSSSAGGNPVKHDPEGETLKVTQSSKLIDSDSTAHSSDESGASLFGLRSALHEMEEDDELSNASSQGEDERAMAEKERVCRWRTSNLLEDDLDFAYIFANFEEAYANAGRAVAMSWSRARVTAEPGMATDMARFGAVEATATKVRKVDEQRKAAASKKKTANDMPMRVSIVDVSFLRQPGKDTETEREDEHKMRFIEPLAQLMNDCEVGHLWMKRSSYTDEEILNSLRRKATHVVRAAGIPTLHKAMTTADEVRKYLADRDLHMGADTVEPIVLEEFLWQSRASPLSRVRAVEAIAWMCKNLQLGWPIDKVEEPDMTRVSLSGMHDRATPAAQPGMFKALADAMEAGAKGGDPRWLALLASWLQAMASLRLVYVLRRSVPVELYEGWMVFFCKRGEQEHNRAGFYWGVPSATYTNYVWADKFLEEYSRRRQGDKGKGMMGMIFRTDTQEYFSSKEVIALTMNAIAGGWLTTNTDWLTKYSWRRMLPTLALLLNLSPAERFAIGDLRIDGDMDNEAPITLKHAEGKEGKSRLCKLICAAVLSSLAKTGTQAFHEIPAQQWEILAKEARAKVRPRTLEANAKWRNTDITEAVGFSKWQKLAGGGSKGKKSQMDFPKQLAGIPLAPESRDGKRYCMNFQDGKCREEDSCELGLHRCAAMFRGGRTCHGNHPGAKCRSTKRHVIPQEVNPEEGPAQRKAEMDEQEDLAGTEHQQVSMPKYVEDDSIMQKLLPKLRMEWDERRSNHPTPESPRLVAKVCEEEGRGELWLGPIPTAQRLEQIREVKYSIQIYCFRKDPTEVQVEPGGAKGAFIPGTCSFRCEMSNPYARLADMQALKSTLVNSLRQGDNAYVHGVSGISKAPMAAAVMSSMLMGINFKDAEYIINQTHNVIFDKGEQRIQDAWFNSVLREKVANVEVPTGYSCWMANPDDLVVHATTMVNGGAEPICHWGKVATGKHDFEGEIITVETIEQASNQFSGRFCVSCEDLLRASLRLQVGRCYSRLVSV